MRWFKHLTCSSRDEKLLMLMDEFGLEGYAVFWLILEAIGETINAETGTPSLTLSAKNWRKVTTFSPKKFQKLVSFFKKNELFLVEIDGDKTKLSCPNMLKFRDEYTMKRERKKGNVSGQNPDTLRTKSDHSVSVSVSAKDISNTYHTGRKDEFTHPEPDSWIDPITGEEISEP